MPSLGPLVAWPGREWHRYEPTGIDGERLSKLFLPTAAKGEFIAQSEGTVTGWWRPAYSSDGRTWHFAGMPKTVCCEVVPMAFGNGDWLALTYTDRAETYVALTSPDGHRWEFVPGQPLVLGDGSDDPEAAPHPNELVWHQGSWYVLVGQAKVGTAAVFRSDDGTDWLPVETLPAPAQQLGSMETDGTTLVVTQVNATDGPSAWTSADGTQWQQHPLGPPAPSAGRVIVEAAHGRWIGLEEVGDRAWWSVDGAAWFEATFDGEPDGALRHAIVLADGFLALDDRGVPWASSDGRQWAPVAGLGQNASLLIEGAAETGGTTLLLGERIPPPSDTYPPNTPVVWIGTSP
jgi:hypothetical protein